MNVFRRCVLVDAAAPSTFATFLNLATPIGASVWGPVLVYGGTILIEGKEKEEENEKVRYSKLTVLYV